MNGLVFPGQTCRVDHDDGSLAVTLLRDGGASVTIRRRDRPTTIVLTRDEFRLLARLIAGV